MIERFDNIGVAVRDFEKSAAWYEQVGFERQDDTEGGAAFKAGTAVLYIFQSDTTDAPRSRALDLVHNPPGIDHISLRVPDVDDAHRRLVARGVEVEDPPTNQDWGARTVTLLDPDGNRIYLLGPLTS